ncbi:NAD(P)-binding protein [Parathielavia appendiculata]|uniref:NAD(P)-binding protein n=1 Tax=Parathielavia appendiculata TaxID=2587402 RepID=A0AAN6TST1_9PEZI|nr:NAD(P)-binding protein [Parathielavia appendiculata]
MSSHPTSSPRIRVALIGLSSSAKTAWASRAHLPYLLSPRGSSKYEIVALLNSSVSAAQDAIRAYDLPASTRAYGDPAALAADRDVDLVVCNTRVDKHFETVVDSVKNGKDVYVEWPLAQDAKHARELVGLSREAGGRSVVGLQGVVAPVVLKLRGLLEEGRIGKVLSSELRVFGGLGDRATVPEGLAYFTQREVGGNVYTIGFAHVFDMVQRVLGELASVKGDFHLQRPEVKITDPSAGAVKTVRSNVPDLILVSGKWNESAITQQNATLHYRFRRGQPFPGEAALEWTIHGEKGEIRIVSPQNTFIQVGDDTSPRIIEVHDFATDKVDKVEWDWEEWQKDLPVQARGIGALYDAFAEAKAAGAKKAYVTFDLAAKRHEQLEELLSKWQA